jgi:O-methyltransferase
MSAQVARPGTPSPTDLYLDLLKKTLTRSVFGETWAPPRPPRSRARRALQGLVESAAASLGLEVVRRVPFDPALREVGKDAPPEAETMIGLRRLDNLERVVRMVLKDGIPGDLIETGVWRGGACIFMKAVLAAHGDLERTVWVADSFRGLPPPDASRHPADAGDRHYLNRSLAVTARDVARNFERYGLLDERVRFLEGWFSDTLPSAPIARLAVLRLDGDMYGSTIDALRALYPRLSPGGFAIVDDYGAIPTCRQAVEDYRRAEGVTEPLEVIDWTGVFWRRSFP